MPNFLIIAVLALYLISWALNGILMDTMWAMQDPPDILRKISVWHNRFYDPFSRYEREKPLALIWMPPFSGWLTIVVVFILWALPNSNARVASDIFAGEK